MAKQSIYDIQFSYERRTSNESSLIMFLAYNLYFCRCNTTLMFKYKWSEDWSGSFMIFFCSPFCPLSLVDNAEELKPWSNIFHTFCRESSVPMDDNRKCDDPGSRTEASGWFCGGVFSLLPTDLRKEQRKETSTLKQQQQTHTVCNQ